MIMKIASHACLLHILDYPAVLSKCQTVHDNNIHLDVAVAEFRIEYQEYNSGTSGSHSLQGLYFLFTNTSGAHVGYIYASSNKIFWK